jgi:hypothetical protein
MGKVTKNDPFGLPNDNSCVIASAGNLILARSGTRLGETQLQGEARTIMGSPAHNFTTTPIDPNVASQLLTAHGIANTTERGATLDRLQTLTTGSTGTPILVGFPGHRVMLESVTTGTGGRIFNVVDPAPVYSGSVRSMTEAEFSRVYNSGAIIIIPTSTIAPTSTTAPRGGP